MAPATTGHNLIEVLTAMRNYGIGAHVRRSVWTNPGCYWKVTRVKLKEKTNPYKYGKVWGVYYWNGKQIGEPTKIGGVAKKQWCLDAEQDPAMTSDQLRSLLQPPKVQRITPPTAKVA